MLSKRERIIAIVTGAALLIFCLDYYLYTPLTESTDRLRTQYQSLQTTLDSNRNKVRRQRQLNEQWEKWLGKDLATDPSEAESRLVSALQDWSRQSGLTLSTIRPDRPNQKGDVREIRVQASATGPYRSVVRFLFQLEQSTVPVRLKRIQMRPYRDQDSDVLSLELSMSTIYVATNAGAASAAPRSRT